MPFGVNGGGSNIENALLTMAWYFLAILIGAIIHAFVYIILIRSSRGEKGVIKNLFTRHKNKEASKENNVNQFSWYKPYVVSNWYYQKVCNITITNN
jgi:hypothetical protein